MQTPLVSVIVPIYNVAPYLKECLQSLVNQSYENLDIVLVDDGSSDESLEIALEFAAQDSRIFVVSKPNGGLSSARNFGLEFIKGSALRGVFERGVNLTPNSTQNSQENSQNQKSPSLAEGDLGGGSSLQNAQNSANSLNLKENSQNSSILQEKGVENLQKFKNNNFANAKFTHPQTPSAREGALDNKEIQSLTKTHSFNKAYKSISDKEIKSHFTQIQSNFIKSDLIRINDFIIQELPTNMILVYRV